MHLIVVADPDRRLRRSGHGHARVHLDRRGRRLPRHRRPRRGERHAGDATAVGATTCTGEVLAASDWDAPAERKRVRPALPGSSEDVLYHLDVERCWVDRHTLAREERADSRLQRAVGVIYRPETERISRYVRCVLPEQVDVLVHIDRTTALEPLDLTSGWEAGEAPDTYSWGV